ncbi:MAG TPA: YbjN domain-containing protein [Allosphingosinicella sp.]
MTALAALWAVPVQAQMVKAQDPETLVRALQKEGYVAKLGTDKGGDPMITSGISGTTFLIFFYNCTEHKACATIQFHSGYDLKKPIGLDKINEWNSTKRFGRAFIDKENDPNLEMDIDLDDGGISQALFIDNLEYWAIVIADFEKFIGYRT